MGCLNPFTLTSSGPHSGNPTGHDACSAWVQVLHPAELKPHLVVAACLELHLPNEKARALCYGASLLSLLSLLTPAQYAPGSGTTKSRLKH
jgi:hypothetical protein